MSKPVSYSVFIRDGEQRRFEDSWTTLYRELLWGPDAYEEWVSSGDEIDWEPEELSSLAVIDFDAKELKWGEQDTFQLPRTRATYETLLQKAWPGYTITSLSQQEMYSAVREREVEEEDHWGDRPRTVANASGIDEDDDEQVEDEYEDDDQRAWVTLVDSKGKIRQRDLSMISTDLLSASKATIQALANLKPAEVPAEKVVTEGLWIDMKTNKLGFWGNDTAKRDFTKLESGWPKWTVRWAENGYADQCEVSDHPGIAMTDTEALAEFIPNVLSTKRMDITNIIGAVGGELRKTAFKAVGCLTFVLAIPILIAGFFLDKLKESGYAVAVLVVVVLIAYKVIERKFKNKFSGGPLSNLEETDSSRPEVAGPLDEDERREALNRLLTACKFPSVEELEPHFDKDNPMADLL